VDTKSIAHAADGDNVKGENTAPEPHIDGHADEIPTPVHPAPAPQPAELVVYQGGNTDLIPAQSAAEKVEKVTEIATALDAVIKRQGLRTKVGQRKKIDPQTGEETNQWEPRWHVNVEGWQALGTLLGVVTIERWRRPVVDPLTGQALLREFTVQEKTWHSKKQGGGLKQERTFTVRGHDWEVCVDVVRNGTVVASAVGLCSRTEGRWCDADEYAVQSMAATRATSRALKQAAGWVVSLAGYSATPTEEMPRSAYTEGEGAEAAELPAWARDANPDEKRAALQWVAYLIGMQLAGGQEDATKLGTAALQKVAQACGGRLPAPGAWVLAALGDEMDRHLKATDPTQVAAA
jgi:hypothetical protein